MDSHSIKARLEIEDTTREQRDWLEHVVSIAGQLAQLQHQGMEPPEPMRAPFGSFWDRVKYTGFEYKEDSSTAILVGERNASIDAMAAVGAAFLRRWRPKSLLVFTYAEVRSWTTYGGGVVMVTADGIKKLTTDDLAAWARRGVVGIGELFDES